MLSSTIFFLTHGLIFGANQLIHLKQILDMFLKSANLRVFGRMRPQQICLLMPYTVLQVSKPAERSRTPAHHLYPLFHGMKSPSWWTSAQPSPSLSHPERKKSNHIHKIVILPLDHQTGSRARQCVASTTRAKQSQGSTHSAVQVQPVEDRHF